MKLIQIVMCLLLLGLTACGGGGSGGGGAGADVSKGAEQSSSSVSSYSVSLDKSSLTFEALINTIISSQAVTATFQGDGLVVGYPISIPEPSWLSIMFQSSTANTATVKVTPTAFSDVGTYSTILRFVTGNTDGTILKMVDLPINVTVKDPFKVGPSKSELVFTGNAGERYPQLGETFYVSGHNISWTASVNQPWMQVDKTSGANTGDVKLSFDFESLRSGNYSGEVAFIDSISKTTFKFPVSLTLLKPEISVDYSQLTQFQGASNADFTTQTLQVSSNVVSDSYQWSVDTTLTPSWLVVDILQGIEQHSTLASLGISAKGLIKSNYSGNLVLNLTLNGEVTSASVPVNLALYPHRLIAKSHGVALTSLSSLSKLSAHVGTASSREIDTNWTTSVSYSNSSGANWLSVTSAGIAGDDLVLSANPSGLAAGNIYYATITLNSTTPSVTNSGSEKINVGFYVDPSLIVTTQSASLSDPAKVTGIVSDPIRPYVYLSNGDSKIFAYNIYSGVLEKAFNIPMGDLRELAVDDDGSVLFVRDFFENRIQKINLVSNQVITPLQPKGWTICSGCSISDDYRALKFTRSSGRSVLIAGGLQVIDSGTGELLVGRDTEIPNQMIEVSGTGDDLFYSDMKSAPHIISKFHMLLDQGKVTATPALGYAGGYARGFSSNSDGSKLYGACWYPSQVEFYSGVTLHTVSYIDAGENGGSLVTPTNTLLCARYYSEPIPNQPDIWEMDLATDTILKEYSVPGEIDERQLVLSGDGLRIITRSQSRSVLSFLTH